MRKFFAPNIDRTGRLLRGVLGLVLAVAGGIVCSYRPWPGLLVLGYAGFVMFEALRGWCIVRACGIKTRY
jgi:hypothetical protein